VHCGCYYATALDIEVYLLTSEMMQAPAEPPPLILLPCLEEAKGFGIRSWKLPPLSFLQTRGC
jgi:hypothetical protein